MTTAGVPAKTSGPPAQTTTSVAVAHAQAHVKARCSACGERGLYTLESRGTKRARRRRKRCIHCGFRTTTYEVDGEWFLKAERLMRILDQFNELPRPADSIPCLQCEHHQNDKCGFDLPEFMTSEAHDCIYDKQQLQAA